MIKSSDLVYSHLFPFKEPLNSEDDVSDEEDQELFDTENVVVCQYDKVRNEHLRLSSLPLDQDYSVTLEDFFF